MRHLSTCLALLLPVFLLALPTAPAVADDAADSATERIAPLSWLVLPPLERGGRTPFNPSAASARYLWKSDARPPAEGETLAGTTGREGTWRRVEPDEKGVVDAQGIAAAYASVEVPVAGVWLAEILRASVLYVNGIPHAGDVYGHRIVKTPIRLEKGVNHLFAAGFRGQFRIALEKPPAPLFLASWDATLPDVVPGEVCSRSAAVLVVNATDQTVADVLVTSRLVWSSDEDPTPRPRHVACTVDLPPLGTIKVALASVPAAWTVPEGVRSGRLDVGLRRGRTLLDERTWKLDVRGPDEARRMTFRSEIDGSVQYYGLRKPPGPARDGQAIVLTLHGAGVQALGQARSYAVHDDFWIVAPTNRRPFGFDWQDWGRQDAYEVLRDVSRREGFAPVAHVTGHSMGGHGTWHLAVNDPDGFRSVAPSAGWISFDTYGGRPEGPLTPLWRAADAASETKKLIGNLANLPIYILHGTDDDNVPADQAREMQRLLSDVAGDMEVHYAEGMGHWWDGDPAPGAQCVDWPGFFEMFARAKPAPSHAIDWTAPDLSLDADHHWIRLQQPLRQGEMLAVHGRVARQGATRIEIETENVRRFRLSYQLSAMPRDRGVVIIDGQELPVRPPDDLGRWDARGLAFLRGPGGWIPTTFDVPLHQKRPARQGPFKRAFDRRFVLVYGTHGRAEENAAILAKARYDTEQWRYRANGRAVCMTDQRYLERAEVLRGRNVILYGNADTNAAWNAVFPDTCPILPRRGAVTAGSRTWKEDDLCVLLVYPKKDDPEALAAAVAGTGPLGTRLGFRVPYFVSGVGIPDFVVFGPEVLERGDEGVRTGGFFDVTWQLADGQPAEGSGR